MNFIDEQTKTTIYAELNESVIHGTMRSQDLIPAFLEVIKDTPEYLQMCQSMPSYIQDDNDCEWWDNEGQDLTQELFDTLDAYAPDGYYFGAHIGDGSDYGYWENI